MNAELIAALKQIKSEKNIDPDMLLDALDNALLTAFKKKYPDIKNPRIDINKESGKISVFADTFDKDGNVTRSKDITPKDFGRIAAQAAKQIIVQRIREAERDLMYEEYADRIGDIMTGIVEQSDQRYTLINFGRVEALLPPHEQAYGERYDHGSRLKVLILEVRKTTKGPQIIVSRTHPGLLKRLFGLEVPEIYDGFVEVKSIAREAGHRSKIAVSSRDENVDAVGACVGTKGARVRMVVNELRGEKVDVIEWSEDPKAYVANALSPAKISQVYINEKEKKAVVIVPDMQLSLAIGKEGQNARLAAKLTGWKIDIKSESQQKEQEIFDVEQCQAIKTSGERCSNKVKPGTKYCGIAAHQKLAQQDVIIDEKSKERA